MKCYRIIDLEQRTPEWHAFRKGKIGASMAAAILGIDPWKTKLQLWEDIILERSTKVTEAMQRGIDLEDTALRYFNTNKHPPFKPAVIQMIDYPQIFASLDGFSGNYHVEIKITKKQGLPQNYYAQLQHQMMVLGSNFCYYFASENGSGNAEIVKRDEKFIQNLLFEELAFQASLIDYRPPEPCERDEVQINDPGALRNAQRYQELTLSIESSEKERKEIRERLLNTCKHNITKIGNLKISKVVSRGRVDYQKLVEEYEITDTERFRGNPIESWRIY